MEVCLLYVKDDADSLLQKEELEQWTLKCFLTGQTPKSSFSKLFQIAAFFYKMQKDE